MKSAHLSSLVSLSACLALLAGCAAEGGPITGDPSDERGLADRDGNCAGGCLLGTVCDTELRACVDEPGAPVLISPIAGAVVTGRPRFSWRTADNADESVIEICADVDCGAVLETLTGNAAAFADQPLARGHVFVRGYGRRARPDGTWIVSATATPTRPVFPTGRDVPSAALLSIVGDLDGDGHADVLIGDDFPPQGQGSASISAYQGHGISTMESPIQSRDVAFSDSAVLAGDIDGDGRVEIATPARLAQYNGGAPDMVPILRLGLDADGDLVKLQELDVEGYDGIVALGDVDGDGFADVGVIHALPMVPIVFNDYGQFYWAHQGATLQILYGGPGGWARQSAVTFTIPEAERSALPLTFRSVGDVDGDGFSDLAVGTAARIDEGDCHVAGQLDHVEIRRGGAAADFAEVITRIDGVHTVAPLGDVDGDGLADFGALRSWYVGKEPAQGGSGTCAGSWHETGLVPSEARVYYGGTGALRTSTWDLPVNQDPGCSGQAGAYHYSDQYPLDGWMTAAGDLDGDGFAEIAVASQSHHPGGEKPCWSSGGRVYVFAGSAAGVGTSAWKVLAGTDGAQATFPRVVRAVGSADGLSGDRLVVSAAQDQIVWTGDTGVPAKVRVYAYGTDLTAVQTYSSYVNPFYADGFGSSLLGGL